MGKSQSQVEKLQSRLGLSFAYFTLQSTRRDCPLCSLCLSLSASLPLFLLALILLLLSSAHPVESFARIPHVDILSTDACRICLGFARSLVWPPILLPLLLLPLVYPIFDKG